MYRKEALARNSFCLENPLTSWEYKSAEPDARRRPRGGWPEHCLGTKQYPLDHFFRSRTVALRLSLFPELMGDHRPAWASERPE